MSDTTTVYGVTIGIYSDETMIGVFSTEELAKAAVPGAEWKSARDDDWRGCRVAWGLFPYESGDPIDWALDHGRNCTVYEFEIDRNYREELGA